MRILFLLTLSFFLCLKSFAQNHTERSRNVIDSLKQVIATAKQACPEPCQGDTNQVNTLNKLAKEYQKINTDTLLIYAKQALNLSEKLSYKKGMSKSYNNIGIFHYYKSSYDTALVYYHKALEIDKENDDKYGMAKRYNNISMILQNQGSYNKAIEYYIKALKIDKVLGNKKGMSKSYNGIAINYCYKGSNDTAIEYFYKAAKISEEIGDKYGISNCYNNLGIVHSNQGSYDKAIEYYLKALKLKEQINDKRGITLTYNSIGIVYWNQGFYEKAIEYFLKSLKINEELDDINNMADNYNNIGNVYYDQGFYDKAIEYYYKSLKIDEKIGDKNSISNTYNNIGNVHYAQSSYDKAIKYYLKSLKIKKEIGNKYGIANTYNNIGNVYYDQGSAKGVHPVKRDSLLITAIGCHTKSLIIYEGLGNKLGIASSYNNIGNVYYAQGSYEKVIEYYLKSLKIKKETGDKLGIAKTYSNIAELNIVLSDSVALTENQKLNYLNKAVEYGNKSIELAREIKAIPAENITAYNLMEAYKKLGNHKKAIEFAEVYITTQDSMFNKEKTKALAEMEIKYEAEKKQLQIEKMEQQKLLDTKTIEVQQAQNHKQLVIIFSALLGFVIVLVFSIIILRMFRQKRKANILLAQQNDEITAQRDEIEAQRDLAADQRDLISEQKQELTDSIHYAYRIQSAVIPSDEYISSLLPDYFILYKPRDIVSGDFYWIGKQNNKVIVLAVDCTGHGVPGAFMSMLGVAFLNEIVNKENITSPADILNKLREYIIKALKQKGKEGESKDGMDVAAITIDTQTNKLEYSGANNPLYIVKGEKVKEISKKFEEFEALTEIKPNKQPVSIHIKMESFINHEINLQKGDTIYIFSDGYPDQFGGPKGKKFKYKAFRHLLLENIKKPMKEQKEILDSTFEEWKGNLDQIDDVVIVGIKI